MKKAHVYAIPAIGAALIAGLAQISLPIGPVPFTLQNFAIGLIATVFRPREAVLSVGLYLLLGAIGLPVFAGGGAGLQALVGPTAGYLWFYLVYSGLTSSLTNSKSGVVKIFLANLLGDALVFVGGILSLHFLAGMAFEIEEHLLTLSENEKGWTKEINRVSFNGAPAKFDIRAWSPDHTKMGKGITLSNEEFQTMVDAFKGN